MSDFKPTWWLRNPHLQTLFPALMRKTPAIDLITERLETPDDDFLDLAYPADNGGALVLVFHGLEGSLESHYARGMLKALYDGGYFPVFMHYRGCSGEANRTTRRYHSCETTDPTFLLDTFTSRYPGRDVYAVGFSLGGNMLLRWLNTMGSSSPFKKAVAISVPFDLDDCDKRTQQGLSNIYRRYLLKHMHAGLQLKQDAGLFPADFRRAINSTTFREFDEYATAPLHGFKNADDYYAQCSSKFYLDRIHTPSLVIQAKDDPFITPSALPDASAMSHAISMELSNNGGHVGFISGNNPFNLSYWAEQRTVAFFNE